MATENESSHKKGDNNGEHGNRVKRVMMSIRNEKKQQAASNER
jgi:hypothetical protein